MIVSNRGYAVLWVIYSLSSFQDDEQGSYFQTEIDEELDYYFLYGPELDDIVASLRMLTGSETLFPKWAGGYVQSKERYVDQAELIAVAREYRRRGFPLDCVVQDWCS